VGATFTDGLEVLRFPGVEIVQILEVEPVFAEGSMEYLGSYVAGHDREPGAIQYLSEFPPTDVDLGRIVPVEGSQPLLNPDLEAGLELLMGFRVTESNRAVRSGVHITYDADGNVFKAFIPAELVVCPPDAGRPCEPEYGGDA
jgi:hypothetical protein